MAEILPEIETFARIKVVGVGGGGSASVNRMIKAKLQGVEFVAVNTDAQALHNSHAPRKVHIGKTTTRGLGAGADPEVGRRAAEESEADIYESLKGADMVFITAGEGGGTGSGASPLIAQAARDSGALVIAIVTKPFTFEGERRKRVADKSIDELRGKVDALITIPNDRLLAMIDRKTSLIEAFGIVDDVLHQGVQGISDLITIQGLINLDFADVKAIMQGAGTALMGIGRSSGENRAVEAAQQAIDSPLLEISVNGAKGVLFNVTGGRNMGMHEIDQAAKTITDAVDPDANIIFGAVLDETLDDEIKITVVATGFESKKKIEQHQQPQYGFTSYASGTRTPFINERPAEIVEEVTEVEEIMEPVASIEPEPFDATQDKPLGDPKDEKVEQAADWTEVGLEEDDIDIPAFIRKKVD